MKNIILKSCLIALCLICGLGNAWGEEVTITLANSTEGFTNQGIDVNANISISFSEGTYTELPNVGATYTKIYAGNIINIVPTNATITKIVLTSTSNDYLKTWSANSGTITTNQTQATWTGSTTSTLSLTNAAAGQARIKTVKITYSSNQASSPHTVTFNAGTNGICSTNSLTEASAGAGVTLPSCTPNTNYTFVGWSTTSNPTSADAGEAGTTYKPSSDCTLYAYYTHQAPSHTAHFSINGTIDNTKDCTVAEGAAITFPTGLADIKGKKFVGWVTTKISGTTDTPPTFVESATMGNNDVTYFAVYATQKTGGTPEVTLSQTLQYDSWTYSGSTTDKSSYRLFHKNSYIESASFDLSKLSKVVVYGGTFGGASYNSLTIGDGTNTWKSVTVSGSNQTGKNEYTEGNALSGTGKLRITSNSGSASSNGVRISKVEIYTLEGGTTYSGYCTTVTTSGPTDASWSVEPASVSVEVDKTATATISTDYDGTLSVSSNATGTATATISGKTITVTGVAAGTTTLTVTGAATSNFNAISKTIDVTVTASSATTPAFAYFEETATINVGEVLDVTTYCAPVADDAGYNAYSYSTAICSAIKAGDDNKLSDDYACVYGKVTFKKAGTYVVHVTAPAVAGKYTASEGYITVTVNSSEENVVFDFNSTAGLSALGINVPTSGEAGANNLAEYYYNGAILMQNTNGSTPNREYYEGENGIDLRVYNNSSLTFSGATITKIVITGKGMGSMSANDGNVNIAENGTATWTGSSSSVVLSPNASANMRTITVYYNPATVPSTYDVIYDGNSCGGNTVTGTPSDDNAYEANASVNVAAAASLTREGYTFNGWNTKSNGSGTTLTAEGTFNIAANTVIYAQWLINSYVVTMTAPENGSFTVSDGTNDIASGASVEYKKKLTLTASPETGYKFKRFVITPEGGEAIYKTTTPADYTMGAANVTIAAEFQALNTYTINWSVNGVLLKTEELTEGSDVTAPTEQEIKDALPDGVEKVFTGWVITPTVDADSEPEYVTPVKATANATYYAVFATKTGSGSGTGGDYELVESNLEDWTGEYIIAGQKDKAYLAALPYASGNNNVRSTDATVTDNKITSDGAARLTVTKKDGYYTIKDGTNYWYAAGGSSNNYMKGNSSIPTSNYDTYLWTISYTNNKISIVCKADISRNTIKFNQGNNPPLFSCYEQGKMSDILLFKKSATTGGTTYSDFTTLPHLQLNEANTSIVALENALSDKVEVARTMKADTWNTFCLPFSLTEEEIESQLGENAEVMELSSFSVTGEDADQILHMSFTAAETIEAGKLYMVCLPEGKSTITVEKKEINTTTAPNSHYDGEGYTLDFVGTYTYLEGSKNEYVPYDTFIISSNKFLYVNSNAKLKGFRGYIKAVETSTGNPVKALSFGVVDPLTGISNVEIEGLNNVRIYNLQGQMMNKLQKGINIVNGKKVIR